MTFIAGLCQILLRMTVKGSGFLSIITFVVCNWSGVSSFQSLEN